ncbi:hypothetical protein RJ615_03820 [Klebsiella pneumoniae]|nr:hypothetical protein [Klebsiella pneumoniae]MDS1064436.1 hypothetical protein [Klebsiella pneumoniae]MDS1120593.1 hypothetical protein [Klebsiella pneumoniae]
MNTAPKELRKRLKEAFEKFDLPTALAALEEMETEEVADVLIEKMAQPGAYQIRGNRSKRNKFYDTLLNSSAMLDKHDSICPCANEINRNIIRIEGCFDDIRDSLPKCDISQYPVDIQFWSQIERTSCELAEIDSASDKEWGKIEEKLKARIPTAMPEALMTQLEHGGIVNVDAVYSGLVGALSLTLKMLSFEKKLLHDGKLVAPTMPAITEDHIYKAGSIQLYALSWNALEDAANRTLFFGGKIGNAQDAKISIDHFSVEEQVKFPDPIFFYRKPTDIEAYDFMANRRLHTWGCRIRC